VKSCSLKHLSIEYSVIGDELVEGMINVVFTMCVYLVK